MIATKNLDVSDRDDYQIKLGGELYTVSGNVPVQVVFSLQKLGTDASPEMMEKAVKLVWDTLIQPNTPKGKWEKFWGAMTVPKITMLFSVVTESMTPEKDADSDKSGGMGKNDSGAQKLTE